MGAIVEPGIMSHAYVTKVKGGNYYADDRCNDKIHEYFSDCLQS